MAVPNRFDVVLQVDTAYPHLLRDNSKEANAQFLQRVIAAMPAGDQWGLLSKSGGENGYTFPNGVRTSHDAIALPDGNRVDIIGGSDNPGHPASPTWNVIPPEHWRPSNVWVEARSWPIFGDDGGGGGGGGGGEGGGGEGGGGGGGGEGEGGGTGGGTSVDLTPVLDAVRALHARLDTVEQRLEAILRVAESADSNANQALLRIGGEVLGPVLQIHNLLLNPPTYSGRLSGVFGGTVTLTSPTRRMSVPDDGDSER